MTTTGTYSDFGATFSFPSGTTYPCQVVDWPEIIEKPVDITNHAGGGVTEFIPSGLVELGEFTLSIINRPGNFATFKTAMDNKTVQSCVLSDSGNVLTFQGMCTSVKKEPADATKPDAAKLTVSIRPTGTIGIS